MSVLHPKINVHILADLAIILISYNSLQCMVCTRSSRGGGSNFLVARQSNNGAHVHCEQLDS